MGKFSKGSAGKDHEPGIWSRGSQIAQGGLSAPVYCWCFVVSVRLLEALLVGCCLLRLLRLVRSLRIVRALPWWRCCRGCICAEEAVGVLWCQHSRSGERARRRLLRPITAS